MLIKRNFAFIADEIAIPFWVILIIYSIYEILHGNPSAWIVLIVICGAFVIDSALVVKNKDKK